MAENYTRYVARVPIVPDDVSNSSVHKTNEIVMDFDQNDIYIKKSDGYFNITGKIKEDVKEIQDGSSIIHVVTEDTLPPIKDRDENNWYWVITKAEETGGGGISTNTYIYYGLIQSYYESKNYILVAQNMTTGSDVVQFIILDGYCPCFYVPVNYSATFKNNDTGEDIEYEIKDRIYAMNTSAGTYITYDVYLLKLYTAGTYNVKLSLEGSDYYSVSFDTNEPGITDLVLPQTMPIPIGDCIGAVADPTWNDPRYSFKGYSIDSLAKTIIDTYKYKPTADTVLYAWFEYDSSENKVAYYSTYSSES